MNEDDIELISIGGLYYIMVKSPDGEAAFPMNANPKFYHKYFKWLNEDLTENKNNVSLK